MNAIELSNVNYSSDQFNLKNISFKVPQRIRHWFYW